MIANYTPGEGLYPDFKGPLCDVARVKPCKGKYLEEILQMSLVSSVFLSGFSGLKIASIVLCSLFLRFSAILKRERQPVRVVANYNYDFCSAPFLGGLAAHGAYLFAHNWRWFLSEILGMHAANRALPAASRESRSSCPHNRTSIGVLRASAGR